jgi:Peroxiredoxin
MLGPINIKGREIALVGNILKTGQKAPDFKLTNVNMNDVSLNHYKGHIIILATVPSLDTPTCSLEARYFNLQAALLNSKIKVLVVSKDLPFAQAKWCMAKSADNIITLSAYKNTTFAKDYGVLLEHLELLARAVFIIDEEGIVRYIQYVKDLATEPDYDSVLQAAKKLLKEKRYEIK